MSRRAIGCTACGGLDHTLTSCDTEAAAEYYERAGRPEEAAKVRRRMALIATRHEPTARELLDHSALARRSA